MYPFILVPNNELDHLSDYFSAAINSLLSEWSFVAYENINVEVDNAFNLSCEELTAHKEHIYQGFNVYILGLSKDRNLFNNLFYHPILNHPKQEPVFAKGEVFGHLVSEMTDEMLNAIFGDIEPLDQESTLAGYSELISRGSGAIYVKLDIDNSEIKLVLPRIIYEHLLPEKLPTKISTNLHDINIDNIDTANELDLNVSLNPTVLNISDLVSLAEGDYLVLDHNIDIALDLYVNNEQFTTCRLGKLGNKKAINLIN